MRVIPSPGQAKEILLKYNNDSFHIQHAETVARVMRRLSVKFDPGQEDYWETVGLLHDVDFELYPEEHCKKAPELLREDGVDEGIIRAVVSHGWGICTDVEPERYMEKVLYAVDELTGLIGATALMRPTGISDMEPKSVIKKFKDKGFAAGCSRDVIRKGAELMGVELNELIAMTIEAMKD
jgi:predicted hydrolase (HD superfamily)